MSSQNLRDMGKALLLPTATLALTFGIFVADTITDLEIAFPAFYTVIVLLKTALYLSE
jgi:hypothetical protein